jgi:toxoflavin synthase
MATTTTTTITMTPDELFNRSMPPENRYSKISPLYDAIDTLPLSTLCQQQVEHALGPDCTGLTVLDLGGGLGQYARKAVDRGARKVDIVDGSHAMIAHGRLAGIRLGRSDDPIRWFPGDVSQPLWKDSKLLALDGKGYDIVMANWTFDQAESAEDLNAIWTNAAAFCKPNGKLISLRVANPTAKTDGRYGVMLSKQEAISGGTRYIYTNLTSPVSSVVRTTLELSSDFEQSKALARKHDFVDFTRVPDEQLEVVKRDRAFWSPHVADPLVVCVTAKKRQKLTRTTPLK